MNTIDKLILSVIGVAIIAGSFDIYYENILDKHEKRILELEQTIDSIGED